MKKTELIPGDAYAVAARAPAPGGFVSCLFIARIAEPAGQLCLVVNRHGTPSIYRSRYVITYHASTDTSRWDWVFHSEQR